MTGSWDQPLIGEAKSDGCPVNISGKCRGQQTEVDGRKEASKEPRMVGQLKLKRG